MSAHKTSSMFERNAISISTFPVENKYIYWIELINTRSKLKKKLMNKNETNCDNENKKFKNVLLGPKQQTHKWE